MSFLDQLRMVRLEQYMTQNILAAKVGVSQANWSKYETGELDMPEDVVLRTLTILDDARLKAVYQYERGTGVFNMPVLTGIDENPYTVLNVVIEEAEEMIKSAECLKKLIRNKMCHQEIPEKDWLEIMKYEEQICDVQLALQIHLIRMHEVYGLDLKRLEARMMAKLRDKNYL